MVENSQTPLERDLLRIDVELAGSSQGLEQPPESPDFPTEPKILHQGGATKDRASHRTPCAGPEIWLG